MQYLKALKAEFIDIYLVLNALAQIVCMGIFWRKAVVSIPCAGLHMANQHPARRCRQQVQSWSRLWPLHSSNTHTGGWSAYPPHRLCQIHVPKAVDKC